MLDVMLLVLMVLLSAFFSGIEIAFMSLSTLKVKSLVKNKVKNSNVLENLKKDPQRLLILILIGNNLVNVAASALATALAINKFGSYGIGIATGIMTLFILVFGEIVPKAYCTYNAEKIALGVSPFISFLSRIMYPVVEIFFRITAITTKSIGRKKIPLVTEDEVKNIITISEEEGSIKSVEREMIHNVFRFDDITVGSVMIPRPDIFALDQNKLVKDVINEVVEEGFSRIPVYEGGIDNITGVLFMRDLLKARPDQKIKQFVRAPILVPETKMINALFQEMNKKKTHLAVVVDEHGTVTGIVTIEDLVEEIVGEIYDETDEVKSRFKKLDEKTYMVDADSEIKMVNKKLNISIHGNIHKNISAFILDKLGRIPSKGETISLPACTITVDKVEKNRISRVKIKLK